MSARPIEWPDGVDGRPYVTPLRHSAWRLPPDEGGSRYRRAVTRDSPVRFALTYLSSSVTNRHTGVISFSPAHLGMAEMALEWMAPRPRLDGVVLPRGGAKTTWLFRILPLWALAHGWRRFFLAFSLTADQAEGHLAGIRRDLLENRLLLADFPELARRRGPGASDTKRTVTMGGATIAARGLGGSTLGVKSGDDRPDLIVGDDMEPDEAAHTPERKRKIESLVVNSILPMGDETTVVALAGTTTMAGSLMHDVVRAALPRTDKAHRVAPWIAAHGLVPHYWPAILDEGTPDERSLWPQRWSLEELHKRREKAPQDYALNMANRPEEVGARGYWTPQHIRYDARLEVVRRILYVDPAMTNKKTSDLTALVMLGVDRAGRRAVVEYAAAGRWVGLELRERMWKLTEANSRTLKEWVVESNQGGERWSTDILDVRPPGVELDLEHVGGSKRSRIEVALKHYQRGAVVHAMPLPQLEEQQLAWTPAADKDDLLDALAGSLRRAFPSASVAGRRTA